MQAPCVGLGLGIWRSGFRVALERGVQRQSRQRLAVTQPEALGGGAFGGAFGFGTKAGHSAGRGQFPDIHLPAMTVTCHSHASDGWPHPSLGVHFGGFLDQAT